ncbi:MAG: hypothetical protein DRH43_00010 [Deltaproteobacteria bacterium]|nr:MAG: hypothetical protein DRH43_00010 [Deltaproteobacteria bacterium]
MLKVKGKQEPFINCLLCTRKEKKMTKRDYNLDVVSVIVWGLVGGAVTSGLFHIAIKLFV